MHERLIAWKDAPDRHPLLVRGARQVGKTWSIVDFGRAHFPGVVHVIDFEQRPAARDYFLGDLDPRKVLSGLELLLGVPVRAGRDLLFLDEIQACPRALVALRYFYEQMPELHVVAAGSLVEFALAHLVPGRPHRLLDDAPYDVRGVPLGARQRSDGRRRPRRPSPSARDHAQARARRAAPLLLRRRHPGGGERLQCGPQSADGLRPSGRPGAELPR